MAGRNAHHPLRELRADSVFPVGSNLCGGGSDTDNLFPPLDGGAVLSPGTKGTTGAVIYSWSEAINDMRWASILRDLPCPFPFLCLAFIRSVHSSQVVGL